MLHRFTVGLALTLATGTLAACGGGSSSLAPSNSGSGSGGGVPVAAPPPVPVTVPPVATMAPVTASALPMAQLKGSLGFTNAAGFTVYVFDADLRAPGTSQCTGACAGVWPAVTPTAGAALSHGFSTIVRSDGVTQLTYGGRPLYTFTVDQKSGDVNGDGINSFGATWHIARPQSSVPTQSPTQSPTQAPTQSPTQAPPVMNPTPKPPGY